MKSAESFRVCEAFFRAMRHAACVLVAVGCAAHAPAPSDAAPFRARVAPVAMPDAAVSETEDGAGAGAEDAAAPRGPFRAVTYVGFERDGTVLVHDGDTLLHFDASLRAAERASVAGLEVEAVGDDVLLTGESGSTRLGVDLSVRAHCTLGAWKRRGPNDPKPDPSRWLVTKSGGFAAFDPRTCAIAPLSGALATALAGDFEDVFFSPNGRVAAVAAGQRADVYQVATGARVRQDTAPASAKPMWIARVTNAGAVDWYNLMPCAMAIDTTHVDAWLARDIAAVQEDGKLALVAGLTPELALCGSDGEGKPKTLASFDETALGFTPSGTLAAHADALALHDDTHVAILSYTRLVPPSAPVVHVLAP